MAAVKDGVIQLTGWTRRSLRASVRRRGGDDRPGAVKSIVAGEDLSNSYRGTGIFVKRNGRWQIAGVHVGPDLGTQSLMPPKK